MPELPEVETIARQLRARGVEGKQILSVKVNWARTVEPLSVASFPGGFADQPSIRFPVSGNGCSFRSVQARQS